MSSRPSPTTHSVLLDARRIVRGAFHGIEEFSCLTGSCAARSATVASDVDIVVVLGDGVPVAEALAMRESFTREYVRLHRRHGRPPDLTYPGEVLYRSDLVTALRGACLSSVDGRAWRWCHETEPYRFWVSMIATGVPLTGSPAFGAAADRCADVIVAHVDHDGDGPRLDELGISRETVRACPRLARRLAPRGADRPPAPVHAERPPSPAPVLDTYQHRWQEVAELTRDDRSGRTERGRPPGRGPADPL